MSLLAIPQDERLPGVSALLDGATARMLLQSLFKDTDEQIHDCRVDYVRYRPGTSCTASYLVQTHNPVSGRSRELSWYARCLTPKRFSSISKRADARVWTQPPIGSPVIALREHSAILFAYPNDYCLDGLQAAANECMLRQVFQQHLSERSMLSRGRLHTRLVRYRPEHRAVLHCQIANGSQLEVDPTESGVYLKIYSDDRGERAQRAQIRVLEFLGPRSDILFPRVLGFAAGQRMLMLGTLPGATLKSLAGSANEGETFARVGGALARLHAHRDDELPRITIGKRLDQALLTLNSLQQHAPSLSAQMQEVGHRITALAPRDAECTQGFVHGDFLPGNIFVGANTMGFLDLDVAHNGCIEADLGKLLAHLDAVRVQPERAHDTPLRDAFLEAYMTASGRRLNPDVLGWWTAVAMIQRATRTFRQLEPTRLEKAESLMREAMESLDRKQPCV